MFAFNAVQFAPAFPTYATAEVSFAKTAAPTLTAVAATASAVTASGERLEANGAANLNASFGVSLEAALGYVLADDPANY